jgi:HPt (histidine-containing phosphotransfer) domain-containing protein
MNPSLLPSKPFDKNYLLRLLNGNTEMMGVLLNELFQNIPNCMSEINSSLLAKDPLGVATYASRAKSAMHILREDQLAEAFSKIEQSARNGKLSVAESTFSNIHKTTISRINNIQESV